MNKIQELALKQRIAKAIKQNKATRKTPNFHEAKEIGLLFYTESPDQFEEMNLFYRLLKNEGKKVEALTFFVLKNDSPYNFPYHFITEADITWDGKINSDNASLFIEKKFDFLFCVCTKHLLVFDYLLAKSQAYCRVGSFQDSAIDFFELLVAAETSQTEGEIIEMMLKTTQAITNNG